MADAYAPLATVAGVAISPDAPLVVAATGLDRPGLHDAEHVDAERRLRHPLAQRRSAAAVAELHATTSSFAPRASSSSAHCSAKRSSSACVRVP
jgi:hypothetical protein